MGKEIYDIHSLESLTAEELRSIIALDKLRMEAVADAGIIKSEIYFCIGEDKKELWNDTNNAEYITHSGIWQARYLHQTYDVTCTAAGIYETYKEAYFANGKTTAASYFRSFVRKLREKKAAQEDAE